MGKKQSPDEGVQYHGDDPQCSRCREIKVLLEDAHRTQWYLCQNCDGPGPGKTPCWMVDVA